MKKYKILAVIGIIIIILAITGYFSYKTFWSNKQSKNLEQKTETANWPTYKSEKFSFSVKYPEGWKFQSFEDSTIIYKKADIDWGSSENSYIKMIEGEFGHGLMGIDRKEKKEIDIFGVRGIRENFYSENELALVIITFTKDGKSFSLEFNPSEDDRKNDIEKFEQFLLQNK